MTKETVPSTDLWAQTRWALQAEQNGRKGKGCNIGYALAANSYERANSVDACTVAALDAITAFAVPNPSYSSRAVGFFGFGGSTSYLVKRITQPTSDGQCYLDQPFQLRLHGVELQTPIRTETSFLGFAPPCGLATLCTGHCSMFAAQDIRGTTSFTTERRFGGLGRRSGLFPSRA